MFVNCFADVEIDDLHKIRDIYIVEWILAPALSASVGEWAALGEEDLGRALAAVFEEGVARIPEVPTSRSFCLEYIESQVGSISRCLRECADADDLQSVKPFMLNGKKFLRILSDYPGLEANLPDRWTSSRQVHLSRELLLSDAKLRRTFGDISAVKYDGLLNRATIEQDKVKAGFRFRVYGSKGQGELGIHWESDLEGHDFRVASIEVIKTGEQAAWGES
jgi:hypothetical protein